MVQEPYNEELGDRDSSDFSEMANRFNIAVDNLYLRVSGTQTTNKCIQFGVYVSLF
jgi:hypothetical protein